MRDNFESRASTGRVWGLYIHWPYCASICPYCDFNRKLRRDLSDSAWKEAVIADLRYMAEVEMPQKQGMSLATVFFGGGTPSLASPADIGEILTEAKRLWACDTDWEVTLEANPTSVESAKFQEFAENGVNRLSLGVQSLRDDMLKYLGRNYDVKTAKNAISIAKNTFERVNLDFIYARKQNDTVQDWLKEVNEICQYNPSHLSLYQLTIEEGTPFYQQAKAGKLHIPDDDSAADMFIRTKERLAESNYHAYEISNFAKSGEECRHNLIYWHYGFYGGIGAGAHGRIGTTQTKYATARANSPTSWAKASHTEHSLRPLPEPLTPDIRFAEKLMMGLRLYSGIQLKDLEAENPQAYTQLLKSTSLQQLIESGYIEMDSRKISASDEGMLRLNSILDRLLNEA